MQAWRIERNGLRVLRTYSRIPSRRLPVFAEIEVEAIGRGGNGLGPRRGWSAFGAGCGRMSLRSIPWWSRSEWSWTALPEQMGKRWRRSLPEDLDIIQALGANGPALVTRAGCCLVSGLPGHTLQALSRSVVHVRARSRSAGPRPGGRKGALPRHGSAAVGVPEAFVAVHLRHRRDHGSIRWAPPGSRERRSGKSVPACSPVLRRESSSLVPLVRNLVRNKSFARLEPVAVPAWT